MSRCSTRSSRCSTRPSPSPLPPRQIANGVADASVHYRRAIPHLSAGRHGAGPLRRGPLCRPSRDVPSAGHAAGLQMCANLDVGRHPGPQWPHRGPACRQDWATTRSVTSSPPSTVSTTPAWLSCCSSLLEVQREHKRDKLLQYASRVWGIEEGDEAQRIDAAIDRTPRLRAPRHDTGSRPTRWAARRSSRSWRSSRRTA